MDSVSNTAPDASGKPVHATGILPLLWSFAFLSYLLRMNIAIAQQYMARELSFSDVQVGYIFSAFLIGYTLFQVPAGMLGDRWGPRVVLSASGLWWGITTLLTGLVPGQIAKGTAMALAVLLVLRFVHGMGEAGTYPVAMTAVSLWFERPRHAFVNSLIFTGSTLGSAFAPPLVAQLMTALGWRATFYVTAIPPILVALLWWRQAKQPPRAESAPASIVNTAGQSTTAGWWRLLTQRSVIALCLSYFLYCYAISIFVYWLFKYLVDVRHLSIVNSGWATSLPWIVASAAVPAFGYFSTRLSYRLGNLQARRLVATSCLAVSALLLFVGAGAQHIGLSIFAIALSVGLLFSTESSYWSTSIAVAGDDAGAVGGLMNLAGNLGGVVCTSIIPVLAQHFGWFAAISSGSVFALLGALVWFFIKRNESGSLGAAHEPGNAATAVL